MRFGTKHRLAHLAKAKQHIYTSIPCEVIVKGSYFEVAALLFKSPFQK